VRDLVARPLSAQALSNLLDRKPHLLRPLVLQTIAAAACSNRPGGASWDRSGIVAHGRAFSAGAAHRSGGHRTRRDYTLRGRAPRATGAHSVARAPAPRPSSANRLR
jgi:hypothetical protein